MGNSHLLAGVQLHMVSVRHALIGLVSPCQCCVIGYLCHLLSDPLGFVGPAKYSIRVLLRRLTYHDYKSPARSTLIDLVTLVRLLVQSRLLFGRFACADEDAGCCGILYYFAETCGMPQTLLRYLRLCFSVYLCKSEQPRECFPS